MAADQGFRPTSDATRQASGATGVGGRSSDKSETGMDRERAIATGREGPTSPDSARRSSRAPAFVGGYGPFSFVRRMTEDMDRLLEHFALGRALGAAPADRDLWRSNQEWMPQVETFRRGDKLVVRADLPGMKKEDVTAEVDDGVLTISGERCDEREDKGTDFFRSERSYGQFCRSIPLPEGVTGDQVEATFKDGVLEVTVPAPTQPERKGKSIPIR